MKKKVFSLVMVLILALAISVINVSAADTASFDPATHQCSLISQSSINYEFILQGNTTELKKEPGYEGFLSSDKTYPYVLNQAAKLPLYSFNDYVTVTQQTKYEAVVHYIAPYTVEGIDQELKTIYIKAGNGVYLVTFKEPLKAGECAAFAIQNFTNNYPALSHFMTCNANFVPPAEPPVYYTDETAWAQGTGSLNTMMGTNKWGWYIPVEGATADGSEYNVYAGAGQNDISKGTLIGSVKLTIVDGKYTATFTPSGLHTVTHMHFGVYDSEETFKATNGAPGEFTNSVSADKAQYIVIHFDAQVAHLLD
ncbi:hypothetical protein [Sinanaerobacter chloroacetimidivorans]|jgi:hypothetical protein|uniref:Uncharacterized protein n=1 Tax=Sinanaerobacter chloroacetimidivorans TaxID=2818044 RepID=A0A8J7VZW3_9FIRM|nr:hypothetical protein [Sinanaerobacter chloroacetimidivorans]MBR0597784.1 hypothetical protein [Sinanaerobacter chloroacetimidivorans]